MRLHLSRSLLLAMLSLVTLSACRRQSGPETPPTPEPEQPAAPRAPTVYRTGEEVLGAMRERYAGKWFTTMTFVQKTSRLLPSGKWNVQTWYEAMRVPGKLRIDFDPVSAGNGVLYVRDSQFVIQNGRPLRGDPGVNELLLLGFDVYASSVAHMASRLRREGFELARVHQTTFRGRPVIVVGARRGDYNRKQFWVDAERLVFVRLLEPAPRDSSKMQDIRFVNYEQKGTAWIAPRVEIWSEGKLVFYEDYEDVKLNVPLDDALFEPTRWRTAKHWTRN